MNKPLKHIDLSKIRMGAGCPPDQCCPDDGLPDERDTPEFAEMVRRGFNYFNQVPDGFDQALTHSRARPLHETIAAMKAALDQEFERNALCPENWKLTPKQAAIGLLCEILGDFQTSHGYETVFGAQDISYAIYIGAMFMQIAMDNPSVEFRAAAFDTLRKSEALLEQYWATVSQDRQETKEAVCQAVEKSAKSAAKAGVDQGFRNRNKNSGTGKVARSRHYDAKIAAFEAVSTRMKKLGGEGKIGVVLEDARKAHGITSMTAGGFRGEYYRWKKLKGKKKVVPLPVR